MQLFVVLPNKQITRRHIQVFVSSSFVLYCVPAALCSSLRGRSWQSISSWEKEETLNTIPAAWILTSECWMFLKWKKRVLLSWHNLTGRLSGFFVLESYCDFLLHNVLAIPLLWLMPRCWPEAVASAHSVMMNHTLQQEGQAATSRTLAFYRSPPACPGAPQWNSPHLTGSLCFFSPHAKLLKEFFWTKCGRRKLGLNVKYRLSRQTLLVELANPIISPRCSPQCSTIWPTAENY